jgi:hypothetical protein
MIYIMHFGNGGVEAVEKQIHRGPVRLLRGEKWWVPPPVREMRKQQEQQGAPAQ